MKKILFTLTMLIATLSLHAHDFEVDGIYYNYLDKTTKTIEVTSGSTKYTGSVIIPSSVTYGGVTYSVTSIGVSAFKGCTGLTEVTIPNSVTSIGDDAFSGCTSLTSITIPNSVTEIGESAFKNTGWYNNQDNGILYLNNCCLGYKGDKPAGILSIKEDTRLICNQAFSGCTGLTEVTIHNSVTSIANYAFASCTGLTSITIPNSVTSIGVSAFKGCTGLTEVNFNATNCVGGGFISSFYESAVTTLNFGDSVKVIHYGLFNDLSNLQEITIGKSVTDIALRAFEDCKSLTTVNFNAENLPSMPADSYNTVFGRCTALKTINIGDNVKTIPDNAFKDCTGLTSITIPNSVTSIGEDAFASCTGLTSITIPNSVTSIGERAFAYCTGLTSVTIPNSVTSIGESAFDGCTGLTSIDYNAENCTSIGSSSYPAFKGCTGTFKIGDNVKSIPAFMLCRADVSAIEMGSSVEKIGRCAFRFCNRLSTVTLPATIKEIDYYAFEACDSLVSIVSLSPTPPTMITAQLTNDYTPTLYVPQGSYELYKNDWHWGDFENIVELVETEDSNTTFAMPQVTDAVAYTVNVYADEAKTQLVATADLDAEETATSKLEPLHLSIDGFENGRYYYDVMAQFATGKTLRNHFGSFAVGNNGIDNIETDSDAIEIARYDIHGRLLSAPTPGFNIVRYSDGTTRKECVK